MTLILSGTNGVSDIDGDASTPAIRGTDANTGMFFGTDIVGLSTGGAEAMRIDSDGDVGIGTTTPANKLHVLIANNTTYSTSDTLAGGVVAQIGNSSTTNGTDATIRFNALGSGDAGVSSISGIQVSSGNSALTFGTRGSSGSVTERMRIDSSGNVGVGVTPSAWDTFSALDINTFGTLFASTTSVQLSGNAYYASGNYKYKTSTGAALYTQNSSGIHTWFNASSGTAGNNITFTERARITSDGYFKASDTGSYNGSTSTYHEFNNSANNIGLLNRVTNASFGSNNALYYGSAAPSASSGYRLLELNSNAGSDIEFNLRGDGNGYADGTWNNNGADYAEFFESANGEALTLGATVVLDGNKVREATDQDPASSVIGVVRPKEPSKASMVVGNTAWNKWANKYLTDDFDRYIMEDHDVVEWEETITDEEGNTSTKQHSYESQSIPAGITVPADATRKTHDENGVKFQHYRLNPAWNPDSEYVNRENRPEWNIIGLLGQVKILKGQPVGDRWIKMRDVSETVEEWMIR